MFVVSFLRKKNLKKGYTYTSSDIPYGVKSGFIFSTDQSAMNLLILKLSKLSTHQELLSDLSIYLTVLHMIGRSKMNQRLNDMTPNRMLLDVRVSPKKK